MSPGAWASTRSVKNRGSYGLRWTESTSRRGRRSASRSPASSSTARSSRAAQSETSTRVFRSSQSCWQRSGPPRACRPRSCLPPGRPASSGYMVIDPLGAALPPRHSVGLLGGRVCEGGRQARPAKRRPAHLRHAHAPGAQRAWCGGHGFGHGTRWNRRELAGRGETAGTAERR